MRLTAVAGSFYRSDPAKLRAEVDRLMPRPGTTPVLGAVAPHAGYAYSGFTAGAVFSAIRIPDVVVILSPNHTGKGPRMSIYPEGEWDTPLGEVRVESTFGDALRRMVPALLADTEAHEEEHGVEVELPFLLKGNPRVRIVPIVIGTEELAALERLGQALAEVIEWNAPGALVLASSDMNHFENEATTRSKDKRALAKLLELEPAALHRTCHTEKITMCGLGPAVAMLTCAKILGAGRAELVDYRTSADAGGDRSRCVGYAGVTVSRA